MSKKAIRIIFHGILAFYASHLNTPSGNKFLMLSSHGNFLLFFFSTYNLCGKKFFILHKTNESFTHIQLKVDALTFSSLSLFTSRMGITFIFSIKMMMHTYMLKSVNDKQSVFSLVFVLFFRLLQIIKDYFHFSISDSVAYSLFSSSFEMSLFTLLNIAH